MYAKITKVSTEYADEEAFDIYSGTTAVYSSPSLVDDEERVLEVCLPNSSNQQYSLELYDYSFDAWSSGSWISIQGINGNVVLKAIMTEEYMESIPLSLYSPIHKGSLWKFTNGATSTWKEYSFVDTTWTDYTPGGASIVSTGTQFYRKQFAGIPNMAAIEVQFKYRYGILAYINGVEVFRDNLPQGEIASDASASGSYVTADYHGLIRSSSIAQTQESILAVEIHLSENGDNTLEFDAFISYAAGLDANNNCFVVPLTSTITSDDFDDIQYATWYRNDGAYVSTSDLPASFTVEYPGNVIPMVNAFRLWPYYETRAPHTFKVEGATSASSPYTILMNPTGIEYEEEVWKQFISVYSPGKFTRYRFTAIGTLYSSTEIYGFQPMVCNMPDTPTISYPNSTYTFFSKYDVLLIAPTVFGVSNCTSNPSLPNGISLNPDTCVITGSSSVSTTETTYTISASTGGSSISGTITLTFTECEGTMIQIQRVYNGLSSSEGFRIRNTENDDILLDVPLGHNHPSSGTWIHYLCVTVDRFDVTLYSGSTVWSVSSFLYLYGMLPEGQNEMLLKARFDGRQNNDIEYFLRRHSIHDSEQWYYKMGEVPANWFNDETANWQQGTKGTFPDSNNRIQLYKKTYTISNLSEVSGLILSIRYRYGVIVYLNGNEAWRNGVTGDLSINSQAENSYADLIYRVVTLPGRFVPKDSSQSAISYLKQGSNTIAIALVSITESQKSSLFDATVRLMTNKPEAHLWEITGTTSGISSSALNPFDLTSSTYISYSSCSSNSLTITMKNDRREWISSVEIQNYYEGTTSGATQFKLYGKNPNNGDWVLIVDVSGLTYSMPAQKRRIYTNNNVPYNQFKFENFGTGNSAQCSWQVLSLNLYADNVMEEIQAPTYESVTVFKDIEMAELIPSVTFGYNHFEISPTLPAGLVIDPNSGWVSGTPSEESSLTTYSVTATQITGATTTATFTLSVEICSGLQGLMTIRIRADSFNNENSWKLFAGRTTEGTPLRSVDKFPVKSSYYYLDFCLQNGLYTFQALDSFGDGWSVNSGYTLTVDKGEMELDIMEVPGLNIKPTTVTTVFSTLFPFQVEYTDWRVYQGTDVPSNWNSVSFDDSNWQSKKASQIGSTNVITTYIRKSFSISGVSDYQVMNVRVKYAGGVAAYLNGNLVARLNLIEDFDSNTLSITDHDSNTFSKFHVILSTAGIQEGTNVFAFEIHRPLGASSSASVVFDATGVFGVEDCSTVVDTYASLTSTNPTSGTLANIMDLDPYTTGILPDKVGTYVDWTVENLMGSKWNSFNMVTSNYISRFGIQITGHLNPDDEEEEPVELFFNSTLTLENRIKPHMSVPVALAGFRRYRWEITQASSSTLTLGSMHSAYCKASGAVCPGEGTYPSVAEGQISPSYCPDGFRGYSYRRCENGQLSEVLTDKCKYKPPMNVRYRSSRMTFVLNTQVSSGEPSHVNVITKWYIDENVNLPAGLTLNQQTGEITGMPTEVQDLTVYTIYAENPSGAASTILSIQVRKGTCFAEGLFPVTEVGNTAVYECSSQGSYIGTQKRECRLGSTDGEWQPASGFCTSVFTIVILILVAIIIIAVIVLVVLRMSRQRKAVGGVKGKKTAKVTKSKPKQETKKAVKV